jgi:pimeloyl-ACP methyl ester carboxylesterase
VRVEVDGATAFAATGGRAPVPGLPAMVFIHGAGLDHSVWAAQSRWFAHHGRNVLAVDLPGHGHSNGPPLPSIDAMADWVAAFLSVLNIQQAVLVGHSMGTLVALATAHRHPGAVRALGLVGAALAIPVHPDLLAAAEANRHEAIDMVSLWGHGFAAGLGGSLAPGLWMTGSAERVLERAAPGVLFNDLSACNAWTDGPAAAASVRCPTVIVQGSRDVMTPPRAGRALAAAIAAAKLTVLDQAGHMLLSERPDAVLTALGTL